MAKPLVHINGLHNIFESLEDIYNSNIKESALEHVTTKSLLFIVCDDVDTTKFGNEFIEDSTWIWENGTLHNTNNTEIPEFISDEELDMILNYNEFLCFTSEEGQGTILIGGVNYNIDNINIEDLPKIYYSFDGLDWIRYDYKSLICIDEGNKVWMYGDNPDGLQQFYVEEAGDDDHIRFIMSGKISASGNIQSLISKDMPNEIPCELCYYGMFQGCTSLTQAPELPATKLTDDCYSSMFLDCTSLTQAPELPANILASYCYEYMFVGCTRLIQAPELPATTLADGCYTYMFYGCTCLIQASELPATTLARGCYEGMFQDCTSLTQAPDLPAPTLAEYCYWNMFYGCTKLSEITTYATSWNTSYASNWLYNVSTSGTFYNLGNADIPSGYYGIPSGWTVLTSK